MNSREDVQLREIRQLGLLEGPDMGGPLKLALDTLGRRLDSWSLLKVHHRPGAGATGLYEAISIPGTGVPVTDYLCASTAQLPDRLPGIVRVDGNGVQLALWQHPNDPLLPGFPWACDRASVGAALFGLHKGNIDANDEATSSLSLVAVSYRPLRRAVMVAELHGEKRFLKVLRHGHADVMRHRHRMLMAAGIPAPELIEVPGEEVLAMHPAIGTPLANLLLEDGAKQLRPETLVELLKNLPAESMKLPARQPWSARVRDYAKGAAAVLPGESARIAALAESIHRLVDRTPAGPLVPSHGDLYEANLLVTGDMVTGVLDVDALGPGHLVDDLACFIGHLAVLPALDERYEHVPAAMLRFLAGFDTEVDPAALRARAAGVTLTLIAGAKHSSASHEGQRWREDALRRLSAAEELVRDARSCTG